MIWFVASIVGAIVNDAVRRPGDPEEFYPASARREMEPSFDWITLKGNRVAWFVERGNAVWIDAEMLRPIDGNVFYPDKLGAVAELVKKASSDDPVPFVAAFGQIRLVDQEIVDESREYAEYEVGPRFTEKDIGKWKATSRDGNHRVFGAILAGETRIPIRVYDNDVEAMREGIRRGSLRDEQRMLLRKMIEDSGVPEWLTRMSRDNVKKALGRGAAALVPRKRTPNPRPRSFQFIGACPDMTGPLIDYITDRFGTGKNRKIPTQEITYETFARYADLDSFRDSGHPATWRMSRAYGLGFYKAQLPSGRPLYFFDWSAMEHLFVEDPESFDLELEDRLATEAVDAEYRAKKGVELAEKVSRFFVEWWASQPEEDRWAAPDCGLMSYVVGKVVEQEGHDVAMIDGTARGTDGGGAGYHAWLEIDGTKFDPKALFLRDEGIDYVDYVAQGHGPLDDFEFDDQDLALSFVIQRLNEERLFKNEAFRSWFADSKVVDDKGRPLVVYRGTRRLPAADGWLRTTQGRRTLSFTPDPHVASVYALQLDTLSHGPGSSIFPAYLSVQRPLDLRDLGDETTLWDFVEKLPWDLTVARGDGKVVGRDDIAEMIRQWDPLVARTNARFEIYDVGDRNGFAIQTFDELADELEEWDDPDRIESALRSVTVDTYVFADSEDVVSLLEDLGVVSWRPFHQDQVKSAIANRGTFDPSDHRVEYGTAP